MHAGESKAYLSHPPLRRLPPPPTRPMSDGPGYFVDPIRGDNANAGTKDSPWRTISNALPRLNPGDTLYLRGGFYFENIYCAVVGRKDAPITIRSFPGEQATICGGIREFFESPSNAWEPFPQGGRHEFRSARPYKNIRDVVGAFGDSMIGLQTYWHAMDLRAENELWIQDKETMVKPVYCGPGLWYDKESGYIHVRLAHTHIQNPQVPNYRGETDPRKLPLIIAPFNSVPLFVDQAMSVRFQDLVICGGGLNTVVLQFGIDIEFDNVTVFCGTYGLRSRGTGPMRFIHSALHGNIPPWGFRSENGLHTYTPEYYDPFLRNYVESPPKERNIARLPTHAVLVTEGSFEFEVFYYPHNHDWEIAYSEFTDGHDGIYLSGKNIRFHHNWVDNFQDDAIYLSSPTPYFSDNLHIYQNLITRVLMAFGCHSRGGPRGATYVYRNIADLRQGVNAQRPTPDKPEGILTNYHIYLMHGREFLGVESQYFYQNTFISPAHADAFAHRTLYNTSERTSRRVFNNIFVYLDGYRALRVGQTKGHDIQCDGNLHWCPMADAKLPPNFLEQARTCPLSEENKKNYPPGWEANSIVADPKFVAFGREATAANDYRLTQESPAVGRGVVLPPEFEDPLRPKNGARPDIGALPFGCAPPRFGRQGRITFPLIGSPRPLE